MKILTFLFALAISTLYCLESSQGYTAKDYSYLIGMKGFSDDLLKIHFKLYEGYVKNTNDLLAKLKTMQTGSYEYGALKRRLGWEFDGMRLHELYFNNLGSDGIHDHTSPLYNAITTQFGSFDRWKKDFIATGSIRGIGWAVLYVDPQEKKLINVWVNEHDTGHLAGGDPILVMDVFEHAYMPQYGLDKAAYISAFFSNVNWKIACERFCKATNPNCMQKLAPETPQKQMPMQDKATMPAK